MKAETLPTICSLCFLINSDIPPESESEGYVHLNLDTVSIRDNFYLSYLYIRFYIFCPFLHSAYSLLKLGNITELLHVVLCILFHLSKQPVPIFMVNCTYFLPTFHISLFTAVNGYWFSLSTALLFVYKD